MSALSPIIVYRLNHFIAWTLNLSFFFYVPNFPCLLVCGSRNPPCLLAYLACGDRNRLDFQRSSAKRKGARADESHIKIPPREAWRVSFFFATFGRFSGVYLGRSVYSAACSCLQRHAVHDTKTGTALTGLWAVLRLPLLGHECIHLFTRNGEG